jgi:hypothetical protein
MNPIPNVFIFIFSDIPAPLSILMLGQAPKQEKPHSLAPTLSPSEAERNFFCRSEQAL